MILIYDIHLYRCVASDSVGPQEEPALCPFHFSQLSHPRRTAYVELTYVEDEGQAEEVLVFRRSISRTGEAKFQALKRS